MNTTTKIVLAVGAGAVGMLGLGISDWRPLVGLASKQAIERRVHEVNPVPEAKLPKVFLIGANGG